ncbi:copper transporter [Russula emetica]|nr:copper transporter [Russula emetica]
MNQTNSSVLVMNTPYLHFVGGDYLYFKSWHPSSHGAIAGASIALVVLAILERLLYATRRAMDARWRRSVLALNTTLPAGDRAFFWKKQEKREESAEVEVISSTQVSRNAAQRSRTLPPFVLSRDAARGALYSLQASLSYALMLAVMTFQAAYIISIIVGLGLGEVLFGRLAYGHL